MLIAFLAFLAMIDFLLGAAVPGLSLALIFSWVFAPVALLMGVPMADVPAVADLLGTKLVANEFVAYGKLAELKETIEKALSQQRMSQEIQRLKSLVKELYGLDNVVARSPAIVVKFAPPDQA
ncbi:hypothetical protein HC761_01310 [bacterium]|nr:hypothetical protein [bacterium]